MTGESWAKMRTRTHTLSMLDVLNASKSQDSFSTGALDRLPAIPEDASIQQLIAALSTTPTGAMLVTNANGEVIDSIDLFRVVRYILALYEHSPMSHGQEMGGAMAGRTAGGQENYNFWFVVHVCCCCDPLLTCVRVFVTEVS